MANVVVQESSFKRYLGCSILDPWVHTRPCFFINSRLNFIQVIGADSAIDTIREFHEF